MLDDSFPPPTPGPLLTLWKEKLLNNGKIQTFSPHRHYICIMKPMERSTSTFNSNDTDFVLAGWGVGDGFEEAFLARKMASCSAKLFFGAVAILCFPAL